MSNANFNFITNKAERDKILIAYLTNTQAFALHNLQLVNTYSYKLQLPWMNSHCMLYTSTLKIVVQGKAPFTFTTLEQFDNILRGL